MCMVCCGVWVATTACCSLKRVVFLKVIFVEGVFDVMEYLVWRSFWPGYRVAEVSLQSVCIVVFDWVGCVFL